MWGFKTFVVSCVAVICLGVAGVQNLIASDSQEDNNSKSVYAGLRNEALAMNIKDLKGVHPVGSHGVYGVLMETGYSEGSVTLIALLPGEASVYFSNGGGLLGSGELAEVKRAAEVFIEKANAFVEKCRKTTAFPIPAEGQTAFYILTTEGVYTAQAKEEDFGYKRNPLSPLFFAGHEVFSQLRLATGDDEDDDEGAKE